MNKPNFLILKDENYFAEGNSRKVYYHPSDNSLCIKIAKPTEAPSYLQREINYYSKIQNGKNVSKFKYCFYAKYYGEIETNLGVGTIFDLIRDETTKNRSKTLLQYLNMAESPFNDNMLNIALDDFKQEIIKHTIFIKDCGPSNLCCRVKKTGSIELIAVDGVMGHRDFLPLVDYWHYFAIKKIERYLSRAHLTSIATLRIHLRSLEKQRNSMRRI